MRTGRRDLANTLSVKDNRTGKEYEIPISEGAVRSVDFRDIKISAEDFGLLAYDPAFVNTASCKSKITFIDGDKGILRYRGYPIEELAEKKRYLEVAYLLTYGELPSKSEYEGWVHNITYHTMVHENVKKFMDGFHHDAHPMGMLVTTVASLSTFYPNAKNIFDEKSARIADLSFDRKDSDVSRFCLQTFTGHGLHLSEQRFDLCREFSVDDVSTFLDVQLRAKLGSCKGARRSLHSSR